MSPKTYTHDWRPLLGNFPSLLRGRLQPGTQFRGKLSLSKRCLLIPRAQESQKPRSQPSGSAPEIVAAVPAWPGSPTLLLAAVTGLAAIAADIFAPWGARCLLSRKMNADKSILRQFQWSTTFKAAVSSQLSSACPICYSFCKAARLY